VTIAEAPLVHLGFASLHLLVGHLGAALVHRLRFGRSPLVLYREGTARHGRITRVVAALSVAWGAGLAASAAGVAPPALLAVPPAVSWGLATAGLLLMAAAQASMGPAFRVGQHAGDPPAALATRGLHRVSRNPIYLGSWLALAGMTLWHPSAPLVALLLATGAGMHLLVLDEERFLRARFGPAFDDYCRRTPRYLVTG
jgi:protein-S-isoprenylcysteine O-methyltransferase Ste14